MMLLLLSVWAPLTPPAVGSNAEPNLDEDDEVVAVVAVGGRPSAASRDTAAAPVPGGSLPVSSSRFMRDLSSSSSSHTVDGVFVDDVDSLPSVTRTWLASERRGSGTWPPLASSAAPPPPPRDASGDDPYTRG